MNDPDGKTIAINLGPTSSSVDYNVWAGNDNIAQARYSGSYSYYYYLKDHLGNVRMTLSSTGSIYTWNDYYPFGESMPGRNVFEAGPDTRYQYTSKERDTETGLDYFGARYYDSWSGQFSSIDPHAELYPSSSPYAYCFDNPLSLVDETGMDPGSGGNEQWQFGFGGITWFSTGSSDQTHVPLTLAQQGESNPASLSANGFATTVSDATVANSQNGSQKNLTFSEAGSSILNFTQTTANTASSIYFMTGLATGTLAGITGAFGQLELSVPLAEISESSFTLSFGADVTSTAISSVQWMAGEKSGTEFTAQAVSTFVEFGLGKFMESQSVSTKVAKELLDNQASESIKAWIESLSPQPAH